MVAGRYLTVLGETQCRIVKKGKWSTIVTARCPQVQNKTIDRRIEDIN